MMALLGYEPLVTRPFEKNDHDLKMRIKKVERNLM